MTFICLTESDQEKSVELKTLDNKIHEFND